MTLLTDVARFVVSADVSRLAARERDLARRHFDDAMLAFLCGLRTPEAAHLRAFAREAAWPERAGFVSAASRLTEIDDIHLPSCTTPSSVAVPVALAVAATCNLQDSDELRSAIWAGTEVICRLGESLDGPNILYRGIWPTCMVAPVGAAAVASRLFGLNEAKTAHALSMALMLSSGNIGQFRDNPSGRWFLFAAAVAQGIRAAVAAREGLLADLTLLDNSWYSQTRGIELDARPLREIDISYSVYPSLSMKPFCSSKQCIAAIEALGQVLNKGISPDKIAKVTVSVPKAYAGMIRTKAQPNARSSTLVSVAHQLALKAIRPAGLYDVDREGPLDDQKIASFASKVEVAEDEALLAQYPRHWPARVSVASDDVLYSAEVISAKGDPENPLSDDDVAVKAKSILSEAARERWFDVSRQSGSDVSQLYAEETERWCHRAIAP